MNFESTGKACKSHQNSSLQEVLQVTKGILFRNTGLCQGTKVTYFVGGFMDLRVIWCMKKLQKNVLLHALLTCVRKILFDSIFKKF